MHKIIIKNFGPVKDCEFAIKNMNFFIGPQASGKSTICKCVYFFKSIRDEFFAYILDLINYGGAESINSEKNLIDIEQFKRRITKKFYLIFGTIELSKNSKVTYIYNDGNELSLYSYGRSNVLNFDFSDSLKRELLKLKEITDKFLKEMRNYSVHYDMTMNNAVIEKDSKTKGFIEKIRNDLIDIFSDSREVLFIPASRSVLSIFTNISIFNPAGIVAATPTTKVYEGLLDYLNTAFVKKIYYLRDGFKKFLPEVIDKKAEEQEEKYFNNVYLAIEIINEILQGEYKFVKDEDRIYIKGKKNVYVKLKEASSGQQESVWILNLIFSYLLESRSVFVVIEEPEAHLFPHAQREIVKLIALLAGAGNNEVLVTTHSPYILTALNNLLYANKVGKKNKEKVNEKVQQEFWVDINKTSAYMVGESEDNYFKSIVDEAYGEILAEEIDKVSTIINKEYSKLYDLEEDNES